MEYKVIGINSGLGVSLYPFKWDLIANLEERGIFHTKNDELWKANFKKPLFRKYEDMIAHLKSEKIKPNIIISSPDCGSGSILRYSRSKKLGDHTKNHSLLTFFRSIKEIKPRFFLFENLEGLFKSFPEKRFDKMLKKYHLVKHIGSVAEYGNSQISRVRLVVVGIKKKYKPEKSLEYWKDIFSIPKIFYAPKTCADLYGDLPETSLSKLGHIRELPGITITMHSRCRMTIDKAREIWQTQLVNKKRWEVKDRKYTTAPGVYRNLLNDYPATARKANRQFDHNGRMLTPRQLARVQGVPDTFQIYNDENNTNYWINKGRTLVTKTPPMEISKWFVYCLDNFFKLNSK